MASSSAPADHPIAQTPFGVPSFYPAEEIPTVASVPMDLRTNIGSETRTLHSVVVPSPYPATSCTPVEAVSSSEQLDGTRLKQRKRATSTSTSTTTPRKRARTTLLKKPPSCLKSDDDDEKKPAATESCCICMCDVENDDLAGISGCLHKFCFECIEKWAERENSCPLCKIRFTKIDRVNKKKKKGQKNTKKVKQRDQRSDLGPSAALEGILASFAQRHGSAPNIARLIFSGSSFTFGTIHGPRFERHTFLDDNLMFSDSDEETPLSSFIRAFHGVQLPTPVLRPGFVNTHTTSRSYASNSNDRNAGSRAENPLEIDDSDDDTVEVVDVINNSNQR